MDKSEKFWDRMSGSYDQPDEQYDPSYLQTISKYLNLDDQLLDYACGTGSFSCQIAGDVKQILAVDISSKMLDTARKKANQKNIENIDFLHANIFDERLTKGGFDVVLAFNILHLLENPQKAIHQINTLMKPGSVFITDTPCLGELNSFFRLAIKILSGIGLIPHIEFFRVSELENMIESDFQIIETVPLSQSPPTRLVVAKRK